MTNLGDCPVCGRKLVAGRSVNRQPSWQLSRFIAWVRPKPPEFWVRTRRPR